MEIKHFIHEVDIPKIPAGSRLILLQQGGVSDLLHHICPVVMLYGHNHLVNV